MFLLKSEAEASFYRIIYDFYSRLYLLFIARAAFPKKEKQVSSTCGPHYGW